MGHELAGVGGQLFEQAILGWSQSYLLPIYRDEASSEIDPNPPIFEHRRGRKRLTSTTEERSNPCQELFAAEGFGEVIVGPEVERPDLILIGLPSAEDENRNGGVLSNLLADGKAVESGHDQIEYHQIGRPVLQDLECFLSAHGASRIERFTQKTSNEGDEIRIVVYHKRPGFVHATSLRAIG